MLRPLHLGAWHTTKWSYKSHLSIRVLHGSKMNMVCGISVSLLLLWLRLDSCIVFTYIQVMPLLVSKASTWKSSDESYTWSPIVFHAFSVDHPNTRKLASLQNHMTIIIKPKHSRHISNPATPHVAKITTNPPSLLASLNEAILSRTKGFYLAGTMQYSKSLWFLINLQPQQHLHLHIWFVAHHWK